MSEWDRAFKKVVKNNQDLVRKREEEKQDAWDEAMKSHARGMGRRRKFVVFDTGDKPWPL